jgi:hypothetical protein
MFLISNKDQIFLIKSLMAWDLARMVIPENDIHFVF